MKEEEHESEFVAWEEDVAFVVKTLSEVFESTDFRFYVDDMNETLYIELEGLNDYKDEEITELAGPVLSELDLDFEEIVLLPLKRG
jgi:hypothetical protein